MATALAELVPTEKHYRFTIQFGEATTTDDAEGEVTETSDNLPTHEAIERIITDFSGKQLQVPPAYSAKKIDGKRIYSLAREGKAVSLPPSEITIHALSLIETTRNSATLEVHCSKGTYIRALGRDIAKALGSCGHITMLRRTRVGQFCLDQAITLANLEKKRYTSHHKEDWLLPVDAVLDDIPVLQLSQAHAQDLQHGRAIEVTTNTSFKDGLCKAIANGKLIALGEYENHLLRPKRVFNLE
jgi:tRNA pseudouridine55 synthase